MVIGSRLSYKTGQAADDPRFESVNVCHRVLLLVYFKNQILGRCGSGVDKSSRYSEVWRLDPRFPWSLWRSVLRQDVELYVVPGGQCSTLHSSYFISM